MRRLFAFVIIAALAAACAKKQAPAGAKSPAPDLKSKDADKESGDEGPQPIPRTNGSDPCEGGEGDAPKKP